MDGKISNFAQRAYIRRYTFSEGKEAGLKITEIDNGVLRFLLNESKALDMPQLWHRGENISFISKNGLSALSAPFGRRFEGGMLYTCGLDSVGERAGYELHGTLHNLPAKIVSTVCNEQEISVTAEIEDTEMFKKNLLLRRTVKTQAGSSRVFVEDTLFNRGFRTENYCLLYHVNLSYPMLDENSRLTAEEETVVPRNDWALKRMEDRLIFTGAVDDNEEERCYFIRHKTPCVKLRNPNTRKEFCLRYSQKSLPCFVQWCSGSSGDYALGLEPATTFLDDKFCMQTLEAGQSQTFRLCFEITEK